MKPARITTVEELTAPCNPSIRAIVADLRKLIRTTVPNAEERVYPVWKGIGYRHTTAGYFCAIFPLQDMVKLGFEYGAFLPDPFHILKQGPSRGRKVRYVEIPTRKALDKEKIGMMLQLAVEYRS